MNRSRRRFLAGLGVAGAWAAAGCAPLARVARVVVIGGGYGGATAAKYVRLLAPDIRVYLVDPSDNYLSCPGSNDVIAGLREAASLERSRDALARRWGVEPVGDAAVAIDGNKRQVRLQSGAMLRYDRLIVSPGIDFRWNAIPGYDEAASQSIPHAWKAGPQTLLLRDQLRAMPEDGLVVISAPANPYRCPPGPYERASLIAHYLQRHKPRAKLLLLDAKSAFSKQALFQEAWRRHYPQRLEWLPYTRTGQIERVDAANRAVHCEFETFRADVLNVIPPQQAGAVARQAGLADGSGWCPVHPDTFASTLLPDIHVIGDACSASTMPKSAFAAGSQAKACAVAVVASLQGRPAPSPTLINTCYSFVTPEEAVSVAGVYKLKDGQLTTASGGETPLDADWREEARYAHGWREAAKDDSFG